MKLTDLPRVLVLDDDAELRGLLIRVLQRDGFAVTAVDTIAAFNHALAQGARTCVCSTGRCAAKTAGCWRSVWATRRAHHRC
jgi:DNA-binding NtrC family response regulator